MYTQHGGGEKRTRSTRVRTLAGSTAVAHSACCVTAFAMTSMLSLVFYPALLAAAHRLELLSSTAILLGFLFTWLSVWLAAEMVLEHRQPAGRWLRDHRP